MFADIYGALNSFVESCSMDGPGLLKALTPTYRGFLEIRHSDSLDFEAGGAFDRPFGKSSVRCFDQQEKARKLFRRMDEKLPFFVKSQKKAAEHHLQDTVDTLDDSLRMPLAHVRDLKLSKTAFERVDQEGQRRRA